MKSIFTFLFFILTTAFNLQAQSDTTIRYYSKTWKECAKDTATYIAKSYAADGQWHRKDYWMKNMQLQSVETWLDEKHTRRIGITYNYSEAGIVTSKVTYEKEKPVEALYYYDNGNKKSVTEYNAPGKPAKQTGWYENGNRMALVFYDTSGKATSQTGWEENGAEMPNYIYEEEAHFPGGPEGWRSFLVSKINPQTAVKAKAPYGTYTVIVQFVVNKEGKIERAEAIEVPAACKKCGDEAIKIINSSPRWEHAIQYGRPVIYQAIQHITWSVED